MSTTIKDYDSIDDGDLEQLFALTSTIGEDNGPMGFRWLFDDLNTIVQSQNGEEPYIVGQSFQDVVAPLDAPQIPPIINCNQNDDSVCSTTSDHIPTWPSGLPPLDFLVSVEAVETTTEYQQPTAFSDSDERGLSPRKVHQVHGDSAEAYPVTPRKQWHPGIISCEINKKQPPPAAARVDWLGKYHRVPIWNTSPRSNDIDEENSVLRPSAVFAAATNMRTAKEGERCTAPNPKEGDDEQCVTTPLISGDNKGITGHVSDNHSRGERRIQKRTRSRRRQNSHGKRGIQASPFDVVGGRGGETNNHIGNRRYWFKILSLRARYRATGRDNAAKTTIAKTVLAYIKNDGEGQGRFLMRDKKTNILTVMPDCKALSKIKQALRDFYVPAFARHVYSDDEQDLSSLSGAGKTNIRPLNDI